MVNVSSTATSISLSWIIPEGSVAASYEVKWSSDQCPDHGVMDSATTTSSSTNYTISNLRPGTNYTVSVTAINSAGNSSSDTVTVETEEEGDLKMFNYTSATIRASVDALCRDGPGQISRERVQRGRLTRQGTTS